MKIDAGYLREKFRLSPESSGGMWKYSNELIARPPSQLKVIIFITFQDTDIFSLLTKLCTLGRWVNGVPTTLNVPSVDTAENWNVSFKPFSFKTVSISVWKTRDLNLASSRPFLYLECLFKNLLFHTTF